MMKPTKLRPHAGREIAPFTASDLTHHNDGESTVLDLVLAERLGFRQARDIRQLIARNREEIEAFGGLRSCTANPGASGGRPSKEFYLNRQQAMLVTILSKTSIATRVRRQLIEVFDAVITAAPIETPIGALNDREAPATMGQLLDVLCAAGLLIHDVRELICREDREKIVPSAAVDIRADFDPIGVFLDDCTAMEHAGRVQAADLHRLYEAWAQSTGERSLSPKALSAALKEHGLVSQKSGMQFWIGLTITKAPEGFSKRHGKYGPAALPVAIEAMSSSSQTMDTLIGYGAIGAFLGMKESAINHLARRHGLPAHRIGRRVWSTRAEVTAWLSSKAVR